MKNPASKSGAIHNDNCLSEGLSTTKVSKLSEQTATQEFNKTILESKIIAFLKGLPHLEFSEKGINNIVKRFGITPEQLTTFIDLVKRGK